MKKIIKAILLSLTLLPSASYSCLQVKSEFEVSISEKTPNVNEVTIRLTRFGKTNSAKYSDDDGYLSAHLIFTNLYRDTFTGGVSDQRDLRNALIDQLEKFKRKSREYCQQVGNIPNSSKICDSAGIIDRMLPLIKNNQNPMGAISLFENLRESTRHRNDDAHVIEYMDLNSNTAENLVAIQIPGMPVDPEILEGAKGNSGCGVSKFSSFELESIGGNSLPSAPPKSLSFSTKGSN